MGDEERSAGSDPPTKASVEVAIAQQLYVAERKLTVCLRRSLRPIGLRVEWWLVLEALDQNPKSAADVARTVVAPKGTVSRWLSALRRRDLVQCPYATNDQRRLCVSLTAEGVAQRQLARARIENALREQGVSAGESLDDLCQSLVPVHSRRNA